MSPQEKGKNFDSNLGRSVDIGNPDMEFLPDQSFVLRLENTPQHLHGLFKKYTFRRATLDEILDSEDLTQDAWPGMISTNKHDLTMRNLINAPMCGAYSKEGKMIGYTRLLWGFDNYGMPEVHSHMTAVSSSLQGEGIGEALKWQARQIALEFPEHPIEQLSVTFDNMQGGVAHVNLNKLGTVCGAAGGVFMHDVYKDLKGKQHIGNPTDRYLARWHLNSDWTLAHLEEKISLPSEEEVQTLPAAVQYETVELLNGDLRIRIPIPYSVETQLDSAYIALPIPLDWNAFLKNDITEGRKYVNSWRMAHRMALERYHANGYTTVFQSPHKEAGVNLQVLVRDFDPFHPPIELLKL